ncbi:MAG TPA: hypothetical protein PLW09_04780 [Candidatus Kapabacteria bacterium]|nr:hypothetical protein [Candidatus Kapabacteria bacterium]
MNIKIVLFVLCVGICISGFTSDFTAIPHSAGAPVSSTGAPEETTCATSSCHDTAPLNSGNAVTDFHINGLEQGQYYIPGHTYRMHVIVAEPEVMRFGFQIVAVNKEGKNVGTFLITDADRTQSMHNEIRLTDRQYLTYTYAGTSAVETGKGEWTFDWKAPETMEEVTFYLATVSANNDGTDKGDYSYTMNKTIRVNSATSVAENTSLTQSQITIAPNPTNEESIIVKLSEPSDNAPAYIVTAINGQRIHPLSVTKLSADKVEIRLAKDIANGVYTLTESRSQITSSFIIHR